MRYLLIAFLIITFSVSPAFAKEKMIVNDTEYTIDKNSEIKNKLRDEYHDGELKHKKIKLKADKTGWDKVDK
jgi:hypothetical protein